MPYHGMAQAFASLAAPAPPLQDRHSPRSAKPADDGTGTTSADDKLSFRLWDQHVAVSPAGIRPCRSSRTTRNWATAGATPAGSVQSIAGTGNNLTRAFQTGSNGTFEVSLPNGTYQVTPTLGDAAAIREVSDLYLEGRNVASNVTTQAGQFIQPAYGVKVTNGLLTVRLADNGGMTLGWALDGLDVVADTGPTASAGPNQSQGRFSGQFHRPGQRFRALPVSMAIRRRQQRDGNNAAAYVCRRRRLFGPLRCYRRLRPDRAEFHGGHRPNVPPSVARLMPPAVSGVGVPITLGSTVTYSNPAEMAAGFTYTWSVSENGSPYVGDGRVAAVSRSRLRPRGPAW